MTAAEFSDTLADNEIVLVVETFGWFNAERKAQSYEAQCLAQRASIAAEEQWSSVAALTERRASALYPDPKQPLLVHSAPSVAALISVGQEEPCA